MSLVLAVSSNFWKGVSISFSHFLRSHSAECDAVVVIRTGNMTRARLRRVFHELDSVKG